MATANRIANWILVTAMFLAISAVNAVLMYPAMVFLMTLANEGRFPPDQPLHPFMSALLVEGVILALAMGSLSALAAVFLYRRYRAWFAIGSVGVLLEIVGLATYSRWAGTEHSDRMELTTLALVFGGVPLILLGYFVSIAGFLSKISAHRLKN